MANTEKSAGGGFKLDVRAYPIAEPKSNTVAFASVTINDMIAINGIRVVEGSKGLFAAMPQAKDDKGDYRDIAFPVIKELRQELNKAILTEYTAQRERDQPEKASVKEQIKGGAKPAPAAEAAVGKTTKKAAPEH